MIPYGTRRPMLCIVGLFFFLAATVWAAEVDLELTIEKSPNGLTPSGTGGYLVFKVINHGPDVAGNGIATGSVGVSSEAMLIFNPLTEQLPLVLRSTDQSDCLLDLIHADSIPPNPIRFTWSIRPIHPIAPGEIRLCYFEYIVNDVSRMDGYFFDFLWGVWTVTETDTNPDNNTASNRYFFANPPPTDIPTASTVGYVILALLMMILARRFRRSLMIKIP